MYNYSADNCKVLKKSIVILTPSVSGSICEYAAMSIRTDILHADKQNMIRARQAAIMHNTVNVVIYNIINNSLSVLCFHPCADDYNQP